MRKQAYVNKDILTIPISYATGYVIIVSFDALLRIAYNTSKDKGEEKRP